MVTVLCRSIINLPYLHDLFHHKKKDHHHHNGGDSHNPEDQGHEMEEIKEVQIEIGGGDRTSVQC